LRNFSKGTIDGEKYQKPRSVLPVRENIDVYHGQCHSEYRETYLVLAHKKPRGAVVFRIQAVLPNNSVHFVSGYDYYQPEAFIPVTGTYNIERFIHQ
jgi:excinuclease ABC subunit B